jgi:hypothetical protein
LAFSVLPKAGGHVPQLSARKKKAIARKAALPRWGKRKRPS